MKTTIKTTVMILSLGLFAGCASNGGLEADVANAQAAADAAMKAAKEAQLDAATAQGTADAAMKSANSAKDAAEVCNERCGRMSEKAMAK
ncbi:MAG: Lpp/OprI family alanine-zipper lipoprotein [Candidatus Thiodiazotropha sp.]